MEHSLLFAGALVLLTGLSLLFLGPLGPVLLGGTIVLVALVFDEGRGTDDARPDERTNCPACGARTDASRDTCRHCTAPLEV